MTARRPDEAPLFRRGPRAEEVFVLNAVLALVLATAWIAWEPELLLQYFYFGKLLALTHLVTLGFLSSVMMGVLYRLAPMLLKVEPSSPRLTRFQLGFFLIGSWGMIAHFWMGEWTGMSWSAFCVWAAAWLQLWSFRALFRPSGKSPWARRFVAASVLYFFLAASLGVALSLVKAYDLRIPGLADAYLANVFAHAHLAGAGWVSSMIFGFQLELVPSTEGSPRWLPLRFWLLELGTLGLAAAFLTETSLLPAAAAVAAAAFWQAYGPFRSFLRGKAREWELLPLAILAATTALGLVLAWGWPAASDPARGRLQLAYGFLGLYGFMALMVPSVGFKLFPVWVWKERFRSDFGKRPVPGMKDLPSETLKRVANVAIFTGSGATALGIAIGSEPLLTASTGLLLAGVAAFAVNLFLVLRWSLLSLDYLPTEADERKFREIF